MQHGNKAFGAVLVAASAASFAPAASAKVSVKRINSETTVYAISVEDVTFAAVPGDDFHGMNFQRARLVGVAGYEGTQYLVGQPEVPVLRLFADGDAEVGVDATETQSGHFASQAKLVPNQPSMEKKPGARQAFAFDQSAYTSARTTASAPFTVENAGSVNGVSRRLVTIYPLQYVPATGAWTLTKNFTVTVHGAKKVSDAASGRERFAILAGQRFAASPALADYIAWKQSLGFIVEQIVVAPEDTADALRAKLQEIYRRPDAHLKYALIVGDAHDVPAHESVNISGVTDHYYRAIDTNDYESDINGPDIGVGRVAVDSEAQLAVVLEKFRRYSAGHFSDERWLNSIAFIASFDHYEEVEASHNYVIDTYTKNEGYKGVFPGPDQAGGDQLYAVSNHVSNDQVHQTLNLGRTIISYSGHGSNVGWDGPRVQEADVRALNDPNALPFVVGNACITGDFRIPESFAETWQRHPSGAITYWGSMDSTFWDEDDVLERAMFDGIYREKKLTFAEITAYAQSQVWLKYGGYGRSKYYWETYLTFGDPSLDLRTTHTRNAQVFGPATLPVGVASASYLIADADGPVVGARVSLSSATGAVQMAAETAANGYATFDLAAAARNTITFNIAASGANILESRSQLKIQPSVEPYLSLNAMQVNGRDSADVFLNEAAVLNFAVVNLGLEPTSGGTVKLTSVEGPATILSNQAVIPALAARDVFNVRGAGLKIKIANDAPSGAVVKVNLTWTTNEGQTAPVPALLRVIRAGVGTVHFDFGTPNGDADGGIRPGETAAVFATLTNSGTEELKDGNFTVTSGNCLTAASGHLEIADLLPGASARIETPIAVSAAISCANGALASLNVSGDYASAATRPTASATGNFTIGILSNGDKEMAGLSVPIKNNTTAEQAIDFGLTGTIEEFGVHVKLHHTYIGDLVIRIVHPDGTGVSFFDRSGGPGDGIDETFGLGGTPVPDFAVFSGKSPAGVWKLLVADTAAPDEGALEEVKLVVRGYLDN